MSPSPRSPLPTVLFVAWQSKSLANGGIQSLTEILRGLAGRIERIVISLSDGPANEVWRSLGCEVHVWEAERPTVRGAVALALSRARRLPRVLLENARLARFVRERGVSVVHCNDITAFWFAAPGARLAGAKVIFNVRDMFPPEAPYGPRWRGIHLLADEIVCLSAGMREEVLARMALPKVIEGKTKQANVDYIYSAVDLERMRPADADGKAEARAALGLRDADGRPTARLLVSNVGAFCEKKNQLGFIEHVVPTLVRELGVMVLFAGDFDPRRPRRTRPAARRACASSGWRRAWCSTGS
ncbi:MAG: glycosyltransferase [Polyangiaceae bacterium]